MSPVQRSVKVVFFFLSYIFQLFKSAGITHETFPVLIEQCEMAINYLTTCGQKVFKSGGYVQKFLDAAKVG